MGHESVPYLTADLPGVGGAIKTRPEDFQVTEIPLYAPSGSGTHVYATIQKTGIGTPEAVRRFARALGKASNDIGFAGLKDASAVTRQTISVEHVAPEQVRNLQLDRVTILAISRHTNKLKTGHLKGNAFVIKIRNVASDRLPRVAQIVDVLASRGVPNVYGRQRFGVRGDNAVIGAAVVRGDLTGAMSVLLGNAREDDPEGDREARRLYDEGQLDAATAAWSNRNSMHGHVCRKLLRSDGDVRQGWRAVDRRMRSLFLSAYQSQLFNRILAERIDAIDRIELGDLAWKHAGGACFSVDDVEVEQRRCDAFEISPSGPIFGYRMTTPTGQPGDREASILQDEGLTLESFKAGVCQKLQGARRPLRVPLNHVDLESGEDDFGDYIRLCFSLPPGSYATSALREICKNGQ